MKCETVSIPGGGRAIVCRRRGPKCKWCDHEHTKLCDGKIAGGKTCDFKMCDSHAYSPAPGKDLCPPHRDQWLARQAKKHNQ